MLDDVKEWERQEDETDESWAAFRNYRDMLPPRRFRSAAARDVTTLQRWYNDFRWKARALAYDRWADKCRLDERAAILKQGEEERTARQLGVLLDAEDLAASELRKLLAVANENQGAGLIKPTDLVKLLELSVKYQRLLRGEATERVDTGPDMSKLSLEELEILKALEEKIKPPNG